MILITGGLGYIGSHVALQLLAQGREVLLVDNLSNSNPQVLERLEYIAQMYIPFVKMDIRNTPALNKLFEQYTIETVIHCAGFKSLLEAKQKPLEYYNNNLNCIMSLMRSMQRAGVRNLIHVSSLMVYGQSSQQLDEKMPFNYQHSNPYIRSMQMVEDMIKDSYASHPFWNIAILRVGNVAGACEHGILGEMISIFPKNIVSLAMQVAGRQREHIELFNHATEHPEGTVERHFVHILDVSDAVNKALIWLYRQDNAYEIFNISGKEGVSMHKVINEISRISQRPIPTVEVKIPTHDDTLLQVGATNIKAQCTLQWRIQYSLHRMLEDQWRFYQNVLAHQQ